MANPKNAAQQQETPVQGNKVTTPDPVVYPFRANGSNRVYDVDIRHLSTMLSRSDLTYIGTLPLPKGSKNNDVSI